MANQIIPLTTDPNQTFQITLTVDGKNITLTFNLSYNEEAGNWIMGIKDADGNMLLDSVPLVSGKYPAANILAHHSYLGIGSAYIINTASSPADHPDATNLGSDFVLVWGDSP